MRFDLVPLYSPGTPMPWTEVLKQFREESILADEMGLGAVWFGEHHFGTPNVDNGAPNVVSMGIDIAARTKQIRLGQIPITIVDHHPVHVAEELAMLDQMSGGRAEAGFGRGVNDRTNGNFHPSADRREDDENYALFQENLEVIIKAWTMDGLRHEGQFWKFPRLDWEETNTAFGPVEGLDKRYYDAEGKLISLDVRPKPFQKPHPPVWLASEKLKSHEYAAERGFGMLSWSVHTGRAHTNWGRYAEIASRIEGRPLAMGERMGVMQVVYVASTMEQAIEDCRYGVNQQWAYSTGARPGVWARKWWLPEGVDPTPEQMEMDWFDFLQSLDCIWVGTPEYVSEKIAKYRDEIGLKHVIIWPQLFDLGHTKVMRMLDLFASDVLPQFREAAASAATLTPVPVRA